MSGPTFAVPVAELVREKILPLLPRKLRDFYSDTRTAMSLGWRTAAQLKRASGSPIGDTLEIRLPGIGHPIFLRTGSTDTDVLEACLVRKYYAQLKPKNAVRFIIDAGANAGYSSIFFLQQYPGALVASLEPDSDNLAIARCNLEPYGSRVQLLEAAIWPVSTQLRLLRSNRHDSTQVADSVDNLGDCKALDPLSILQMFNQERINIFKCDIEGAEERLFADNCDAWLERTDCVTMEIHGASAYRVVYETMRRHNFLCRVDHDLYHFTRP